MSGEHCVHRSLSNDATDPVGTVDGRLRSVKTAAKLMSAAVVWVLCVIGMLSDMPGTHTVRGTRRDSRYRLPLQPLH